MEIIVMIVGAMISFMSLIITKEQKISEFRQKWIDSIRDDISELIGCLTKFSVSYEVVTNKAENLKKSEFIEVNVSTIRDIDTLMNRITLRLNPVVDQNIINTLSEIEDTITNPDEMEKDTLNEKIIELKDLSHKLLKKEWERVKKGEKVFYITKGTVLFVFPVLLISFLIKYFF